MNHASWVSVFILDKSRSDETSFAWEQGIVKLVAATIKMQFIILRLKEGHEWSARSGPSGVGSERFVFASKFDASQFSICSCLSIHYAGPRSTCLPRYMWKESRNATLKKWFELRNKHSVDVVRWIFGCIRIFLSLRLPYAGYHMPYSLQSFITAYFYIINYIIIIHVDCCRIAKGTL